MIVVACVVCLDKRDLGGVLAVVLVGPEEGYVSGIVASGEEYMLAVRKH